MRREQRGILEHKEGILATKITFENLVQNVNFLHKIGEAVIRQSIYTKAGF